MRIALSITTIALGFVVQVSGKNAWVTGETGFYQPNPCGDSTFNIETSSEMPLKEDCEFLAKEIADTGTYFIWRGGDEQNATNDDSHYFRIESNRDLCAFGARIVDSGDDPAVIASQDVSDLLRDSIAHHSTDKYVRTSGSMECTGSQDIITQIDPGKKSLPRKISWQIYKPGDSSLKVGTQ